MLSNLKEMSQAMGGEIERQNKQLDKIGGKTDVADVDWESPNKPGHTRGIPDYLYRYAVKAEL